MKPTLYHRMRGRLRAAVHGLRGQSASISDPIGSAAVFGVDLASGVSVNQRSMLQLSAAWACVRLISSTIATLPLSIYTTAGGGKRVAPEHGLHSILHDVPNPDATASMFWQAMVSAMLTQGCGRAERLMIGERLVGLEFLVPGRLTVGRKQGSIVLDWRYLDFNGKQRIIPASRVWTVPGFTLDGRNGVSVIEYGAKVFGQAQAADQAAGRAFRNGALQNLFYKVAKFLQPDQRREFRQNIIGLIEDGQAPLLEGGIEVEAINISPKDVQLLESRAWSVEEICRWFGVPPWMVGHASQGATKWGSGMEQELIGFLTFCLGPIIKSIEQAITKDLLTPGDRLRYYAKYAVEGLLRTDSAARAAFYGVMVDKGILTRDEVRELEDRPPMGGNAAVLTVQSAMTTLDSLGQLDNNQQARAALRSLLGFDTDEPQKG